jgi:serine/threonine protein kinase
VALVTLLAPGGNLHRALHVQQRQLAPREQLRLSLDLMEGVAHLHSRQPPVVHLDLKSMNLVLDAEGQRIQLCDFGLARRLGEPGGRAGACDGPCSEGSPRYMAPERYDSGLGPTTEKADVWSSACVLIEIFGGGLPHAECSNAQQILKALLVHRRGPSVPASAGAPVQSTIAGALAFEASERPTAAQVLAQLLALEDARKRRESCGADGASHLHRISVSFFVCDC